MAGKILIVDDSVLVRRQVGMALTNAGYATVDAIDGQDATTKVSNDTAMIVCDVNMPRMNGIELLEHLAGNPGTSQIPVVMLTTEGQPEMIQRAKALGAKYWLVKPFKSELLLAVVKKFVA